MSRSIENAVGAGLAALGRMQSQDGSFPLLAARPPQAWTPCGPLFSTAYVMLGAGRFLPRDCVQRAVNYIREKRRPDGLWEYDPAIGIPPDADSTSCCLAVLARLGTPQDAAGGADLLRSFWRQDGGPFRTWRAGGMWSQPERDDAVVNCNIVHALHLLGSPPGPNETGSVLGLIGRSAGGARYYCSPATIVHAARRAGLDVAGLPQAVSSRPPLRDLLGCAQWLCGMRCADPEATGRIMSAQRPDGSWPIRPWVTGAGRPRPFWGSAAITTALSIEALGAGVSAEQD